MPKSVIIVQIVLVWAICSSDAARYRNRRPREAKSEGCTLPPYPENGEWTLLKGDAKPGEQTSTSSIIKFQCHNGYKLSSELIVSVCVDQWTPSKFPECESLCPPLYPSDTYELKCIDKLGRDIKCTEATHGTRLEYICALFYETPFGYKKTLFCENGKWSQPKPVCQPVCGKKIADDKKPLIYGSTPEKEILYPWVAAIFKKMQDSYENICVGSILSQTVVLTAAHCVTNNYGDALSADLFAVGAGKLYRKYKSPEDGQAQYLEVRKVVVPGEYKGSVRLYAADIAVLVMKGELALTLVVQPVCFTNMQNIQLHAGHKGEVAGWGLAEGGLPSEVLRSLEIPYKYETVCAEELPPSFSERYNLKDKICAGFVNQSTSVCRGDSGSGLSFKYREDNRYYIHGVVSLAPKDGVLCDIQQNSLYTRVASYYDFVEGLLNKYAPEVKDCVLPSYPQNGTWTTDKSGREPGDAVPSNTILTVECDEGFKLSSSAAKVECSSAHHMPTCEKLCPALDIPEASNIYCTDKNGQISNCSHSIDGSNVWYTCPDHLKSVNFETSRVCVQGSWGEPLPDCVGLPTECGKVFSNGPGEDEQQYPWTIGLYKFNKKKREYTYACGGTLISQRIVITAASCVTVKDKSTYKIKTVLPHDIFSVAAGKVYGKYNDSRDVNAQYMQLSQIIVHPRFMLYRGFDSDLALLVLEKPFTLNNFVQSACVGKSDDENWRYRNNGTISGWRSKTGGISDKYESLVMRIVSTLPCNGYERAEFYIRHDKMCVEFLNNSMNNDVGDTGKGFILKNPKNGKYTLQGIATGDEQSGYRSFTDMRLHNKFIEFILYRINLY